MLKGPQLKGTGVPLFFGFNFFLLVLLEDHPLAPTQYNILRRRSVEEASCNASCLTSVCHWCANISHIQLQIIVPHLA